MVSRACLKFHGFPRFHWWSLFLQFLLRFELCSLLSTSKRDSKLNTDSPNKKRKLAALISVSSQFFYANFSGDFVFAISSADGSELWLSSNDDPKNSKKIAYLGEVSKLVNLFGQTKLCCLYWLFFRGVNLVYRSNFLIGNSSETGSHFVCYGRAQVNCIVLRWMYSTKLIASEITNQRTQKKLFVYSAIGLNRSRAAAKPDLTCAL